MFNFKKIKEAVTELTSIVLTATLSVGMFSATPVKATTEFSKNIVLVGDIGSGRKGIINRMMDKGFEEGGDGFIAASFRRTYKFNDNEYNFYFNILDDFKNENGADVYIKKSDAIILAVAYDDDDWGSSMEKWLDCINKNVDKPTQLKIVITKSDIQDEDKKITKESAEKFNFDENDYLNLIISEPIETSAKKDIGIRHKDNEETVHCLEDYLLGLFGLRINPSNTEDTKQMHSNTDQSQPKTNSFEKNNNKGQSIFQKSKGFVKRHPAISIWALATVVVTPLVVFRNKIIKGIESIFGKNQNKKTIAKLKELKPLIN